MATYVNRNVEHLSASYLRLSLDVFPPRHDTSYLYQVACNVQRQLTKIEGASGAWRTRIMADAATITGNDFMDEDDKDDKTFAHDILKNIRAHIGNQIALPGFANLDEVCDRMFDLVSIITSSAPSGTGALPLFAPLSTLLAALLGESTVSATNTPPYILRIYRLLELIVQKDSLEWDANETTLFLTLLQRGLQVLNRSVRLSAWWVLILCMVATAEITQSLSCASSRTGSLVSRGGIAE